MKPFETYLEDKLITFEYANSGFMGRAGRSQCSHLLGRWSGTLRQLFR